MFHYGHSVHVYRCIAARGSGDVMKAFTLQTVVLQYPNNIVVMSHSLHEFCDSICQVCPVQVVAISLTCLHFLRSFLKALQALKEDNW